MKVRQPAVAGRFYPETPAEISSQLADILEKESSRIDLSLAKSEIIGAVVPHAGYMFSAYQAMHFFGILKHSEQQFDTFFIINPNHSGYGYEINLDTNDMWETPFGRVEIDRDFCELLDFSESAEAHKFEHSGEVMLPMLQYSLDYDFKIVPVTLSEQNVSNAEFIADSIIKANQLLKKEVCVIASSDFSHFLSPDAGRELDAYVIDRILAGDPEGVYREVKDKDVSVCGFGPIMTLMYYAMKTSQEPKIKVLKTGHSGEVVPSDEVVDYVSILFHR